LQHGLRARGILIASGRADVSMRPDRVCRNIDSACGSKLISKTFCHNESFFTGSVLQ
jgi:hypothetical protein